MPFSGESQCKVYDSVPDNKHVAPTFHPVALLSPADLSGARKAMELPPHDDPLAT
jgi:hypothetical protein